LKSNKSLTLSQKLQYFLGGADFSNKGMWGFGLKTGFRG